MGKEHPNQSVIYNYQSNHTMLSRIARNLNNNTVLFIGDSLTQGMAVNGIHPYAVNFGIGHDTINGVMQRLRTYESMNRVATIIVAVGINDLRKFPVATVLQSYQVLFNDLKAFHNVYIHEVLPIDSNILGDELHGKITLFNKELNKLALDFSNIQLLRRSNKFIDSNGNLIKSLHIGDGLHLSKQGYGIWINQLRKQLNNK